MKIATRTRYAPRILIDLARYQKQGPVQIGEMSRRLGISVKYLEQVIKTLRKVNYISGVRGAKGGYVLSINLEEITLGQLTRLMEGDFILSEAGEISDPLARIDEDHIRSAWQEAIQAFFGKLDRLTLADIMAGEINCTGRETCGLDPPKMQILSGDPGSV